jgi:hypothetical protein
MWAWGNDGDRGALGQNDKIGKSSPVQIGTGTNWTQIAAGNYNSMAIST